jgi:hypothetical protein
MMPNAMERGEGSGTRKRRMCHCKRCRGQHFRLFHICDKHEIQYGLHIEASSSSDSRDASSSSPTHSSQVRKLF